MRAGRQYTLQTGFTYVALLVVIALLGVALSRVGPLWADDAQREREADLIRVGVLYANAIRTYYNSAPGSAKRYPPSLDSLLLDTRFVGVQRHLRRLYKDPLDPARAWGILRAPDGGIQGIYSLDERTPLMRASKVVDGVTIPPAQRYSDWKFMFEISR